MVTARWLLAAIALTACHSTAPSRPAPLTHRALLASFDAMNERRMLETVPAWATPHFRQLFAAGACADRALPAWPSKTAASHASLWTGVYGDSNGITANRVPLLPSELHRITDGTTGYRATQLRAEPIWITAALAGRRVVAHQTTQSPDVPGYPPADTSAPTASGPRARAEQALALPSLAVINGYDEHLLPDRVLTADSAPPHVMGAWTHLEKLGSELPPREIAWQVGEDSLFGLFLGDSIYTRLAVAPARDGARAVLVPAMPADRTSPVDRPLARYYSRGIPVHVRGHRVRVRVRLFALGGDASSYMLFLPALSALQANREEVLDAYDAATDGWVGNGPDELYDRGAFGPTLADGGSGEAEWRYLDGLENMTRAFMAGSAWGWNARRPGLQADYYPGIDEADHRWLGFASEGVPGVSDEMRQAIQPFRARAWQLADLRLGALMDLVARDSTARLWVAGDHGMRPLWRVFHPNVALRKAGLLAADDSGRVDVRGTRALAWDGLFIMLNRTRWRDGMVKPEDAAAVLDSVERVLRAVRGLDGEPVVTRTWRVARGDSLGRGGPAGGDLYFSVAPGYDLDSRASGPVVEPSGVHGNHGFPSIDPDMATVLCAWGAGVQAGRTGVRRTTDARGAVLDWLGVASSVER
ncbi:MAG TPA: alkaline phosphatase family protein [Gemmatimonadales bacterium]|jgi:hypothetical protein|nr:alkaline phosphatase family protein [Gemmatimonadales bacterium]